MGLEFYQQLTPIESFAEVIRRDSFVPAPKDWSLVLSDIRNSTFFAQPFLRYVDDMAGNSDYKKFDDTLRMVLDCSAEQAKKLEKILKDHHKNGEIIYGLHYSRTALMTCIMEGLEQDQHLHFVDGSDGGYALAAKAMKDQKTKLKA